MLDDVTARDTARLVRTARSLLAKGGTLESAAGGERIDDTALKGAVERHLRDVEAVTKAAAAAEVLTNARSAFDKVAGGQGAASLTELEFASLEAIVQVTGRPAMRYTDGRVGMPESELGENDRWRVFVAIARSKINRASASVGRVVLNNPGTAGVHVGTAWRLLESLVVTNRHVARRLVENPEAPRPSWRIDPAKPSFVDFAVTDQAGTPQRFAVAEVAYCAVEDFVDLAVLRLDAGGAALPAALPLDWSTESLGREIPAGEGGAPGFQGEEIYVVGHPYRVYSSEAIRTVFGNADGFKRCSPGFVIRIDPQEPVLEHDCSTLGGNSGSCVLTVGGHEVVGLHFGGRGVDELTAMGSTNVALALSRLAPYPAAEVLRTGRLPG
jgi:hypothetical protein